MHFDLWFADFSPAVAMHSPEAIMGIFTASELNPRGGYGAPHPHLNHGHANLHPSMAMGSLAPFGLAPHGIDGFPQGMWGKYGFLFSLYIDAFYL